MRARLFLACSLLLLAGCDDPKVIGIADEANQPDGGLTPLMVDQTLAHYAKEIAGAWESKRPDAKITFTPSQTSPRGGSAQVEGFSEVACIFVDCPVDSGGRLRPPPFEVEYWFLRLTENGALVTLPDPTGFPFAINCTYVPATVPRLDCGPEGRFQMLRAD